jgi:hypothetical protein
VTERDRLLRLLRETISGSPFYGPSLAAALEGVSASMAARKPAVGHSIWEIVVQVSLEIRYSSALLLGTAAEWKAGETTWRAIDDESRAAWDAARDELGAATAAFVSTEETSSLDLGRPVPGYSISYYEMVAGSAQHVAYHAGQVMLLKRLSDPEDAAPG